MTKRLANWNGMNWIRKEKRLAIYLRDGLACRYCGAGVEDEVTLTLDHLVPDSRNGSNSETNLITCCKTCNSARGNRPWRQFALAVAAYKRIDAGQLMRSIRNATRRKLGIEFAKALIAKRGCFSNAVRVDKAT